MALSPVAFVLASLQICSCTLVSSNYAANEFQSYSSSYAFSSSFVQFGPNPEEEGGDELFEGDIEFDDPNINEVSNSLNYDCIQFSITPIKG